MSGAAAVPVRGRVLVVDDSPSSAKLLEFLIGDLAPDVLCEIASDRAAMSERLRDPSPAAGGLPRLVLLDWHLADADGAGILRELRAQASTRTLPVVVLSGSRDPAEIRAALEAGANAYVVKPRDFAKSRETVEAIVRFWLHCNERPGPA